MLQGFQNNFKTEIGLTVHEIHDLILYVYHVTHEPLVRFQYLIMFWNPCNIS